MVDFDFASFLLLFSIALWQQIAYNRRVVDWQLRTKKWCKEIMKNSEIKQIMKILSEAEEALLDLPLTWQEEAAEGDIDTLHTANTLSETLDFLKAKIPMFHVTLWETREVVKSFEKLAIAKRWARGRGHTGEDDPGATSYPPLAYVANDDGDLVYNPRFGKNIRADVSGIINAQPSNHF
jgi:hypothetical protein